MCIRNIFYCYLDRRKSLLLRTWIRAFALIQTNQTKMMMMMNRTMMKQTTPTTRIWMKQTILIQLYQRFGVDKRIDRVWHWKCVLRSKCIGMHVSMEGASLRCRWNIDEGRSDRLTADHGTGKPGWKDTQTNPMYRRDIWYRKLDLLGTWSFFVALQNKHSTSDNRLDEQIYQLKCTRNDSVVDWAWLLYLLYLDLKLK